MSWQILIALSIFFNSFAVLVQRVIMKNDKSDAVAWSIFSQLFTGTVIGLVGLFLGKLQMLQIQNVLLNIGFMIFLYAFGNIFLNNSLKLIDASEMTILFTSKGLFTIAASTFFLSEGLGLQQYVGAFLIIGAVILVTYKKQKISLKRGEWLALGAALLYGLAVTNDRMILKTAEVFSYVSFAYIVPALFTMLLYPKKITKMKFFIGKNMFLKATTICLLYAVSSITFFIALQLSTNSSQVAAIGQLTTVVTVILAVIILKENKEILKKILGGLISMIGVMLLG